MQWMFPKYEKNITQLANKCAQELNMSPQWLRQKLSKWNSMTEVPKEDNFIKTIAVVSRAMKIPVRSLVGLDNDQDVKRELMMYQLGLNEVDLMRLVWEATK